MSSSLNWNSVPSVRAKGCAGVCVCVVDMTGGDAVLGSVEESDSDVVVFFSFLATSE